MVYRGTVKGGVIEVAGGMLLPEGTPVQIEVLETPAAESGSSDDPLFKMSEIAVDTGIADLATNIDHYLYGAPKVDSDG